MYIICAMSSQKLYMAHSDIYIFIAIARDETSSLVSVHFSMKNIY